MESNDSLLKYWRLCSMDAKVMLGGLIIGSNASFDFVSTHFIHVGITLEGNTMGLENYLDW